MEFPEVGQQCDHRDCKQLEFLPLKCKCGKVFCSEHFNKHLESCEFTISNVVTELRTIEEKYTCSLDDCKSTSIVPLLCDKCGKHFCIQHRHINDCQLAGTNLTAKVKKAVLAPIQQYNDAKALVDKELDKTLATARKKSKNIETVNKVQLMRIKNKAVGLKTIPPVDRIYFNIKYPSTDKTIPVFVSKTWTVGKTIDAIAQELKIPNNNNQVNSSKLRLFHADSGQIIATVMSEKMDQLVARDAITNGQSLILEYVPNDCLSLNN